MMEWLRWHLEGNVTAIVLVLFFVAAIISAVIFGIPVRNDSPSGFGPDWDCVSHPKGDPTCIKKVKP
jgi:hypothetical protein